MARDEVFKTKDEKLMKAIQTVRDLINNNNTSLTFFSELEKSITKEASEQKQTIANKENKAMQKKLKKQKFKVSFARKMKIRKKERRSQ